MAKDEEYDPDLNLEDDGLDDELSKMEQEFGLEEEEPPKNEREAVTRSLKKTSVSFKNSFKSDPLDTASTIAKEAIPSSLNSETREVTSMYDDVKSEYVNAAKELRVKGQRTIRSVERLLPENKALNSVTGKIKKLLGDQKADDEESGPTKEQIQQNNINASILELLGEQNSYGNYDTLLKERLESNRHKSNLELQTEIITNLTKMRKFDYRITDSYYRKSLELQYKSLFTSREQLTVIKSGMDMFKTQLESIVRNTGLPEMLKYRQTEAIKENINQKARDKVSDFLYKNVNPFDNIKKNLLNKGKEVKDTTLSTFGMIDDMADNQEMMSSMTESVGKENIIGTQIADFVKGKVGGVLGDRLSKTERGQDAIFKVKDASTDLSGYLDSKKESIEDDGLVNKARRSVFGLISDLSQSPDENKVEFESKDMDDISIFDNRAHSSLVKVIPGLLSKIHGEVKSIRIGDDSTGKKELMYDFDKDEFISKEKKISNIEDALFKKTSEGMMPYIDNLVKKLMEDGGLDEDTVSIRDLRTSISKYIMDGNTLSPSGLAGEEFLSKFRPKEKDEVLNAVNEVLGQAKEDPSYMDGLIRNLRDIKYNAPTMASNIQELYDSGAMDVAKDMGLVNYDMRSGNYEYDKETMQDRISKSIRSGEEDLEIYKEPVDEEDEKKESFFDKYSSKVKAKASEVGEATRKKKDEILKDPKTVLKTDFNKAKDSMDKTISKASDTSKDYYEKTKGFTQKYYGKTKDTSKDYYDTAKDKSSEYFTTGKEKAGEMVDSVKPSMEDAVSKVKTNLENIEFKKDDNADNKSSMNALKGSGAKAKASFTETSKKLKDYTTSILPDKIDFPKFSNREKRKELLENVKFVSGSGYNDSKDVDFFKEIIINNEVELETIAKLASFNGVVITTANNELPGATAAYAQEVPGIKEKDLFLINNSALYGTFSENPLSIEEIINHEYKHLEQKMGDDLKFPGSDTFETPENFYTADIEWQGDNYKFADYSSPFKYYLDSPWEEEAYKYGYGKVYDSMVNKKMIDPKEESKDGFVKRVYKDSMSNIKQTLKKALPQYKKMFEDNGFPWYYNNDGSVNWEEVPFTKDDKDTDTDNDSIGVTAIGGVANNKFSAEKIKSKTDDIKTKAKAKMFDKGIGFNKKKVKKDFTEKKDKAKEFIKDHTTGLYESTRDKLGSFEDRFGTGTSFQPSNDMNYREEDELLEIDEEQEETLRSKFYMSPEFRNGYITSFQEYLQSLGLKSRFTRDELDKKIKNMKDSLKGKTGSFKEKLTEHGKELFSIMKKKRINKEEKEELRQVFYNSREFQSGQITDFELWLSSQGYTSKSLLSEVLKKTRKLDRAIMKGAVKYTGKGIKAVAKSPYTVGKGIFNKIRNKKKDDGSENEEKEESLLSKTLSKTRSLDRMGMKNAAKYTGKGIKEVAKSPYTIGKGLFNKFRSNDDEPDSDTGMKSKMGFPGASAVASTANGPNSYDKKSLDVLEKIHSSLKSQDKEKSKEKKNVFDRDNSGYRDGSWRDRIKKLNKKDTDEGNEKNTKDKIKAAKEDSGWLGSLVSIVGPMLLGIGSKLGSIVSGVTKLPGLLMSVISGLGAIPSAIGSVVKGGISAVKGGASAVAAAAGIKKKVTNKPKADTKKTTKTANKKTTKTKSKKTATKVGNKTKKPSNSKIMKFLKKLKTKAIKKLGPKAGAKIAGKLTAKIASRAIPFAGQALLAYDATMIAKKMLMDDMDFDSAASEQIIGVDLFDDDAVVTDENGDPIKPDEQATKDDINKQKKKSNDNIKDLPELKEANSKINSKDKPINKPGVTSIKNPEDDIKKDTTKEKIKEEIQRPAYYEASNIEYVRDIARLNEESNQTLYSMDNTLRESLQVQIDIAQSLRYMLDQKDIERDERNRDRELIIDENKNKDVYLKSIANKNRQLPASAVGIGRKKYQ